MARKELKAKHERRVRQFHSQVADGTITQDRKVEFFNVMYRLHEAEMRNLKLNQRLHVAQHGDPDAAANARREANAILTAERVAARRADVAAHRARVAGPGLVAPLGAAVRIAPPARELAAFAGDNQNVHTTHAVQQTKDIVNKVLEIHVPDEYRWNKTECSKTPGEIIMLCKLSPTAAWQMTSKYCQAEEIYELGAGIYGRVLDCVWQFILASPDKDDLVKIVKTEMEDNIGMCAQGNLSRLCNILSGYLDGIVIRESPAEIMARLIANVIETSDRVERAKRMTDALVESKMPHDKWHEWAESAFDDNFVITNNSIQIVA